MDAAEQRYRADEYINYIPTSPPDSIADDTEATLVPSHDSSMEDTLTEDSSKMDEKEEKMADVVEEEAAGERENPGNDSGIVDCGDGREFDRVDENYSIEMKLTLGIDDKKE